MTQQPSIRHWNDSTRDPMHAACGVLRPEELRTEDPTLVTCLRCLAHLIPHATCHRCCADAEVTRLCPCCGYANVRCVPCGQDSYSCTCPIPAHPGVAITKPACLVYDLLKDGVEHTEEQLKEDARGWNLDALVLELRQAGAKIQRQIVTFPGGDTHYTYRMTRGLGA